jgi:hypothetical protein
MKIVNVPVRVIFNEANQQVCASNGEQCLFFNTGIGAYGDACTGIGRGIIDFKPHRLCLIQAALNKENAKYDA